MHYLNCMNSLIALSCGGKLYMEFSMNICHMSRWDKNCAHGGHNKNACFPSDWATGCCWAWAIVHVRTSDNILAPLALSRSLVRYLSLLADNMQNVACNYANSSFSCPLFSGPMRTPEPASDANIRGQHLNCRRRCRRRLLCECRVICMLQCVLFCGVRAHECRCIMLINSRDACTNRSDNVFGKLKWIETASGHDDVNNHESSLWILPCKINIAKKRWINHEIHAYPTSDQEKGGYIYI